MYIYVISNKLNGKTYVGKTTQPSIQHRWMSHIRDSARGKTRLYNAIKKYGIDQFEIYVMESTGVVSREQLNKREIYWIEVLEPEYNMTKGGDGGWIHDQTGNHWKVKDTSRMKNKKTITPKVIAGRLKNSGSNNYQSRYFIHTPWGVFETWTEAIKTASQLKARGCEDVITDSNTLRKYCLNDLTLSLEGRRIRPMWRGKSTRSLGFFVEEKQ